MVVVKTDPFFLAGGRTRADFQYKRLRRHTQLFFVVSDYNAALFFSSVKRRGC